MKSEPSVKKRVIKFRVWDGDINKFIKGDNYGGLIDLTTDLNGTEENPIPSNYHIEQFTGFTDKHGKEIYEGDLLKYQLEIDYDDKKHKAICKTVYGVVQYVSGEWLYGDYLPLSEYRANGATRICLRIAGNVHQNSKLLS